MTQTEHPDTDLPSLNHLRAATSPPGSKPFNVGILVGPGFIPMDMVGVQTVFGLMPGARIHLIWKSREAVEGFPSWWTLPTMDFASCPDTLDVFAVPMLPPELLDEREVVAFVARQAAAARYVIGICNGVVMLGAAGALRGRRVTASFSALSTLTDLGVAEIVPVGAGVVVDGNLYTAGPGVGSFEAALRVAAAEFGVQAGEMAELLIEYDPHPPFGTGSVRGASPAQVTQFEGLMAGLVTKYRDAATRALAETA